MGGAEGSGKTAQQIWDKNVLNGTMEGRADLDIPSGVHTLQIWGTDPSVILDKILISFTDMPPSYLGLTPVQFR
jgi:hypothetical protein